MPPAKLELNHISMVYTQRGQRFVALRDVSLQIDTGEFISIVGASGCGKTTLLRIADGLVMPTQGQVRVDGQPVTRPGPDRGFVFQQDALFPWRTVLANIIFGLEVQGKRKRDALQRADELVRLVGLAGFEQHFPHELSGGMRQRANLARALTIDPDILLMDEPFAALDAQTRELMQAELLRVWRSNRKTVMFVTHQIDEAVYLADRVVVMTSRPGQIKAVLEVDIPRPRDLSVKRTPRFLEMVDTIWRMLEEEVKAALRITDAGQVDSRPLATY
ncbi:MAG: ABC transporter ATP-binding protein [Chloroflexi bacterium]|nr:ABC transporter ATP-binding protein [Chloroflexota bacterium]MBV9600471.1 ABC transporter ATP-binding protein [Chloroflexota bacterium]